MQYLRSSITFSSVFYSNKIVLESFQSVEKEERKQSSEKFLKLIAIESSEQSGAFLHLRTFLSRLSAFTTYVGNCLGYLIQINF